MRLYTLVPEPGTGTPSYTDRPHRPGAHTHRAVQRAHGRVPTLSRGHVVVSSLDVGQVGVVGLGAAEVGLRLPGPETPCWTAKRPA